MNKKPKYYVKESAIHGRGVFAKKDIKKGKKIIEYLGEIISWDEADNRFEDKGDHSHTMFFSIEGNRVIDGNVDGNEARFINHSCSPNCEAIEDEGRVFIYSKKKIKKDDELFYDYMLIYDGKVTKKVLKKYACFCGKKKCRGTQLDLEKK